MPLYQKFAASMIAGAGGSLVGSPADVVLVRMQADGKAPPELRHNYKNAFDGLYRIAKSEGIASWWRVILVFFFVTIINHCN
jgi:solute carrier family 25 oxoglutarate transporter 11